MSRPAIFKIELSPSDRRGIFLYSWYKGGKPWLRLIRRFGGWANILIGGAIVMGSALSYFPAFTWVGVLNIAFGIYFMARPHLYLYLKRKQLVPTRITMEFQELSLKFTDESGSSALLYSAIESTEHTPEYWVIRITNGPSMFFPKEKLSEAEWKIIKEWEAEVLPQ